MSEPINTGGPAFPDEFGRGMSLREYAAVHAMEGLLGNAFRNCENQHYAQKAVELADALIKELNK